MTAKTDLCSLHRLSDEALAARVASLAREAHESTAALLAHLGELDARRLYLGLGFGSLFAYVTQGLGFSESEAGKRIQVARLARRVPAVLDAVASGRVHLSGLCALAPHLDEGDAAGLLAEASGRSRRDIELLLAARLPKVSPPAPPQHAPGHVDLPLLSSSGPAPAPPTEHSVAPPRPSALPLEGMADPPRTPPPADAPTDPPEPEGKVASPRSGAPAPPEVPARPAPSGVRTAGPRIEALAGGQVRVSLTAPGRVVGLLERARALLGHAVPGGDAGLVLERALELLVTSLEKRRFGARGRHAVPAPTPRTHPVGGGALAPEAATPHASAAAPKTSAAAPRGQASDGTSVPSHGTGTALREQASAGETRASSPRTPARAPDEDGTPTPRIPAAPATVRQDDRRRHIPAAVRRTVYDRDGGRCAFVGADGTRCSETRSLELHHTTAWSRGGPDDVATMALRCRAHNQHEARRDFGSAFVEARIRERRSQGAPGPERGRRGPANRGCGEPVLSSGVQKRPEGAPSS
jgi:5-methylcytosine-specific restriction endonuclease McrA